ncbi:MAG: glycosyltransferase family 2 protein [Alphaproteobacteria bacterium]|nr:glycosyltransferase family 2 protein [Alphaproteobacteria bacterium]
MFHVFSTLRFFLRANGSSKVRMLDGRRDDLRRFLASGQRHHFPQPVSPRATLIIPVFNHAYHTLACLLSLLGQGGTWLEIMVWDDGSTDETETLLSRFDNLRVCKSTTNQGFLRSVNAAVAAAQGQQIILLNNDARWMEGSLELALSKFSYEPNCGVMGARICLASGGLQEAGAMIFADGGSYGYLRHRPVDDPRGTEQRDVDYCSGVLLIFERETFRRLGGFDEIYAPAYYEETDFCLRVWQEGLRCVYYPGLLIEHFEFGSRPTKKTRDQITRNRKVFLARWGNRLKDWGHFKSFYLLNEERAAWRRSRRV